MPPHPPLRFSGKGVKPVNYHCLIETTEFLSNHCMKAASGQHSWVVLMARISVLRYEISTWQSLCGKYASGLSGLVKTKCSGKDWNRMLHSRLGMFGQCRLITKPSGLLWPCTSLCSGSLWWIRRAACHRRFYRLTTWSFTCVFDSLSLESFETVNVYLGVGAWSQHESFYHSHCPAKNDGLYLSTLWRSMPLVTQMIHHEW